MITGRPTSYSPGLLDKANEYLDKLPEDEVIPSIEGLALFIGITRTTVYDWRKDEEKADFSYIVEEVLAKQARSLLNNGLNGKFSPAITKVILTKHGYREGVDHTTNEKDITFAPGVIEKRADDILSPNGQGETKTGDN